jgi:hypothetical protein
VGQKNQRLKSSHTLQFPKRQLPRRMLFGRWESQLPVANPLKSYLLNFTMLKTFKYGTDADALPPAGISRRGKGL